MNWREQAACRGEEPGLFFQEDAPTRRRLRALCASCPVSKDCREYAVASGCEGWWGGTTEAQRERLRKKRYRVEDPAEMVLRLLQELSRRVKEEAA